MEVGTGLISQSSLRILCLQFTNEKRERWKREGGRGSIEFVTLEGFFFCLLYLFIFCFFFLKLSALSQVFIFLASDPISQVNVFPSFLSFIYTYLFTVSVIVFFSAFVSLLHTQLLHRYMQLLFLYNYTYCHYT